MLSAQAFSFFSQLSQVHRDSSRIVKPFGLGECEQDSLAADTMTLLTMCASRFWWNQISSVSIWEVSNVLPCLVLCCKSFVSLVRLSKESSPMNSVVQFLAVQGFNINSCCRTAQSQCPYQHQQHVCDLLGFSPEVLQCLPLGVAVPLKEALHCCCSDAPTDWPIEAYRLLGLMWQLLTCHSLYSLCVLQDVMTLPGKRMLPKAGIHV